jgi:hypothetical protein
MTSHNLRTLGVPVGSLDVLMVLQTQYPYVHDQHDQRMVIN